jgi:uncharacterized protein (TIGR00299 family) protein
MKVLYIDPASGISGNMLLGALLDMGADMAYLEKVAGVVSEVTGHKVEVASEKVKKHGFPALWVDTHIEEDESHSHGSTFKKRIEHVAKEAGLSDAGRKFVSRAASAILEAEGAAHGETLDHIHLHELGSPDTIVDIVGTAACLDSLGLLDRGVKIYSSTVYVGSGKVTISHGEVPIPPPVTSELLKRFEVPFSFSSDEGELATPTGVVLLASLVDSFGEPPAMKITSEGKGAGTFELDNPNILRIIQGEALDDTPHGMISVLETNLDDVTGEVLGHAVDRIMEQGALDVQIIPTITKKNRPGHIVMVLTETGDEDRLSKVLMEETGSLGVRVSKKQMRHLAAREIEMVTVEIGGYKGKVGVKVSKDSNGKIINAKPEYDDALKISEETGVPLIRVLKEIERAYHTSKK